MKINLQISDILSRLFLTFAAVLWASLPAFADGDSDYESSEEDTHIPAIIKVRSGDVAEAITELQAKGIDILHHRGNLLLAYVPVEMPRKEIRGAKSVEKVDYSRPRYNQPAMDMAKAFNNASFINEGIDLPQPFDGSGVVVGVCDTGMDTRHINFYTSDGRECRIRRLVHYQEGQGKRDVYDTPEEIYNWRTDDEEDFHATHVTGIAAGGYKENGLNSLASNADIVFTSSQLSDVGLLAGVEDIIEYAKQVEKPCVINLSMGNNLGPHDGTSLFTQYLDLCADDAIICISAGNDGKDNSVPGGDESGKAMTFTFTDEMPEFKVRTTNWDGLTNYGEAQIWSRDSNPFAVSLVIFPDTDRDQPIEFATLEFTDEKEFTVRYSADENDPDYDEMFAGCFNEGYVEITGGIDPENNRYRVIIDIDNATDKTSPSSSNRWANWWPGMKIEAATGYAIDIYTGGNIFLRKAKGIYPSPDNRNSISDLATGKRTISVGMLYNRTEETMLSGKVDYYDGEIGDVYDFSSYGTLADGRIMPLTCAPGHGVVSSVNGAWVEKYSEIIPDCNAVASIDGSDYYWGSTTGTSMSCPYVVSGIATWLQADPKLTTEEVMHFVQQSNKAKDKYEENPRYGQGVFSPYDGLQAILEMKALIVDRVELEGVATSYSQGMLTINNMEGELDFACYDVNGTKLLGGKITERVSHFDLSTHKGGVYILVLENRQGLRKIQKLFVN